MTDEHLTKLHVDLPHHWAVGGESLWARPVGGGQYRIENVPFYAYGLNFHDVVAAHAEDPMQKPSVQRVVARSGHSTLRVMFDEALDEATMLQRLALLQPLHAGFERCSARYFALDLEPGADVDAVREVLDGWEAEGVAHYETCEARVAGSFDDAPEEDAGDP